MIQPLNKNVLIKDCQPPDKSKGGILMPFPEPDNTAIVVDTGAKVSDVRPGDKVIYNDATAELSFDGVTYRIVPEENILCVLES